MGTQALFVFGLGYSTTGIARQAQNRQVGVTSTCRSPDRFARLESATHRLVKFDPASQQQLSDHGLQALRDSTYVLSSIPPIAAKLYDPVLQAQLKLLRQAASSSGCRISGLGYLSSTGVYGDWEGDWVDERSEPRTASGRGILRLEAEAAWAALADQLQMPITIFRLGGIYGPRRSMLHNVQAQEKHSSSAARRSRQRYTSRCHVADVAQAVLADMQRRMTHAQQQQQCQEGDFTWPGLSVSNQFVDVVNIVDNEPAPRGTVKKYALQLLGSAPSTQPDATASLSSNAIGDARQSGISSSGPGDAANPQQPGTATQQPMVHDQDGTSERSTATQGNSKSSRRAERLEEKRVSNDKLKLVLGVQLLAPTYREGLCMMHAGDITPFLKVDLDCIFDN